MKICFLYESVFTSGGIQRCITILSNYLIKKGYDVTILCTNSNSEINRKMYGLDENVKIIFSKKNNLFNQLFHSYRKILIPLNRKFGIFKNNLYFLKKLYYPYHHDVEEIINNNCYDIVISSATYCNSLISFLNIKKTTKIGWQHGSHFFYFQNGFYKNQDRMIDNLFSGLDSYIVLTEDDKQKIKSEYGYDVKLIHNPIEYKQSKSGNINNKKFIAAGRLNKEKRFDLLIKNFFEFNKINKEWKLNIYGDGPEKDKLLNLINELNLNQYVEIFPFCNDIYTKYIESSIYCMTSISEGFGMVVVEALESGLPVISYDIPSMKEILTNDCGLISKEGNNADFVNSMLRLSSDKKLYNKFSKNAKLRAKNYYIENIGKQWENLFYELKGDKNDKNVKKNNKKTYK